MRSLSRLLLTLLIPTLAGAAPLGNAFTYQGELRETGALANGLYDLEVKLFDAAAAGAEVAPSVLLDAVPVENGRFTVALDFGAAAFSGNERFLQIGVRPDGGGAYTVVLPRQLLRATPEALRAKASASAPWTGLTGVPAGFADNTDNNSGGTVTQVGAGTGLSGGPITSSGTLSVDGAVVQMRVTGTCTGGQSVASINANGTVNCVAGGGGGVTQITAGDGLSGGTITTTGTIAVAKGGITSDMLANGAVGLAQINTAQVQARISSTCPAGRYFRGVSANGTVVCELLPGVHSISVADDPAPVVGFRASMALGDDGLPVIAHAQGSDPSFALRVTHCNDVACSGGDETSTVVDSTSPQTGISPAIAIGGDGNPVIAYRNNTTGDLWVAKCNDVACAGNDETRTMVHEASSFSGYDYPSIAVAADNLPVIAYTDYDTGGTLMVAKCNDAACAGGNETITALPTIGREIDLQIAADGFPIIAHESVTIAGLLVTKCNDAACSGGGDTTAVVDDTANILANVISMQIRANGRPLIVHRDSGSATLRIVDCNDNACAGSNETKAVLGDNGKSIGGFDTLAMAIGPDGVPAIAFFNTTDLSVRLAQCGDDHCFAGTASFATLEDNNIEVRGIVMAMAPDNTPVVAYQDFSNGRLKVVKCGTRSCQ